MRIALLLIAAVALLLACGGDDIPGPDGGDDNPAPDRPSSLAFTVQPALATAGQVMRPAVQVSVKDAGGKLLTSSTASITLSLNSSGATLNGQATRTATEGVAVFSDLSITKAASHYSLSATATDLNDVTSAEFVVLPGPASAITIHNGDAQEAVAGRPVLQPPSVLATDEFGNPVRGVSVAFEVVSGGGTVDGAGATTGQEGVAAVTSWRLGTSPGPNTLRATAGTLAGSPLIFTATGLNIASAITIEVHNDFFRSVRNGSGIPVPRVDPDYAVDTVAVGGTVTWLWMGQNHNVTKWCPNSCLPKSLSGNEDAPFTLGPMTFSSPGRVFYRCTNHSYIFQGDAAIGMAGVIVVR